MQKGLRDRVRQHESHMWYKSFKALLLWVIEGLVEATSTNPIISLLAIIDHVGLTDNDTSGLKAWSKLLLLSKTSVMLTVSWTKCVYNGVK